MVPDVDDDDAQLFVVIDNIEIMEVQSYTEALFALFGVHYAFNLEYPKKQRFAFQFLEEYVFGIPQKKKDCTIPEGSFKASRPGMIN